MIPITQEFLHDPENGVSGDCMRACIASLLELPISAVPHFLDGLEMSDGAIFGHRVQEFLRLRNLMHLETSKVDFDVIERRDVTCYHLIYGLSERGVRHAVVGLNGVIVHDPHPSRTGLVEAHRADWTHGFLVYTGQYK